MDFISYCRGHGLILDSLPPEGVWRRYPTTDHPNKRNGAAKFLGDVGFVQNHATSTEVAVWKPEGSAVISPRNDAVLRQQRESEAARRKRAIKGAREFWNAAKHMRGLHAYLSGKGLGALGAGALRVHGGLLVAPVVRDSLVSVQTIAADGEKRFWPGASVKAGALVFGRPNAAVTCLVEGVATGLAVFQAVRKSTVIVAFDAGNLLPVAERLKPKGSVVVAADNDHRTQARIGTNPGLEKGRNVAEWIGCGVAYPRDIEGSDWCDALKEWGEGAPRRIEREILAQARFVVT